MTWGLENVTIRFGPTVALADVTIEAPAGRITAIVGGDGAGKTTAVRALVGLLTVEAGRVNRPASIGYQPASSGVWRDLTVNENLRLVAGAHSLPKAAANQRIETLLGVTGLSDAGDRLGGQLSGGMRQKLGVAMALVPEPDLLVLDEPTTGLDPVSRLDLWAFIARAAGDGTAVLLTTTYFDEASRADSIIALEGGSVLASGSMDDVVATMPGAIFEGAVGHGSRSWRRRGRWRTWSPDGSAPEGSHRIEPDLADAVVASAIQRREAS